MDRILLEDFESFSKSLDREALKGAGILITGATGLVGSFITRSLYYASEKYGMGLKLYALVRSEAKARDVLAEAADGVKIVTGDISQPLSLDFDIDYIIHCAAVTNSKQMVTYPAENILTSVEGTRNILELAREKAVKGMVYLSSMEVYGAVSGEKRTAEGDYGYVDPLRVRSCHPEGKRMAECLCSAYQHEYGVPVCIARLAQCFGAGVLKSETRVFFQFARSLMEKKDIVLHTTGESVGNYCYLAEAAEAIVFLLTHGESAQAYNVVNESSCMAIRDMAALVADMSGGEISVVFDIPEDANKFGYAPPTQLRLSGEKLARLGWQAKTGLKEAFERMIGYMRSWEQ